jgi:hypothetical protein
MQVNSRSPAAKALPRCQLDRGARFPQIAYFARISAGKRTGRAVSVETIT